MANLSNKKRHQQFGLKLLVIALIVGFTFTIWYLSEKRDRQAAPTFNGDVSKSVKIPADDLREMKNSYLSLAKKIVENNYSDVSLAENFRLFNFLGAQGIEEAIDLEGLTGNEFWKKFNQVLGELDKNSLKYKVAGNQVTVYFSAKKDSQTRNFIRKISFGNYELNNRKDITPVLKEDAILLDMRETSSPIMTAGFEFKSSREFEAVREGKIVSIGLDEKNGNWKLFFFFPEAFTYVCPTECLGLLENFDVLKQSKVDVYAISSDLPNTLLAWDSVYFGGLPYSLVADPDLSLAARFGFAKLDGEDVAFRGTVVLDPDNRIRYLSVRDNDVGRNIQELIRVIKALQTPGLKPEGWKDGEKVLEEVE